MSTTTHNNPWVPPQVRKITPKNKKIKKISFIDRAQRGVYAGVFKWAGFQEGFCFVLRPLLHCVFTQFCPANSSWFIFRNYTCTTLHLNIGYLMLDQHSSTPNLMFITLWLSVWSWSNCYIILLKSLNLLWEVSRLDAPKFLRYRRIKNTSQLYSSCACLSAAVVTWPCDVIAVTHLFEWMFNSYLQLELRIKNIWHTGHDKTMANFKSVAYVYNGCRSKYNLYTNNTT